MSGPQVVYVDGAAATRQAHSAKREEKKDNVLALLLLIALSVLAVCLTFVALFYLFSQTADGLERVWYDEGWLQAVVIFASTIAVGYVAHVLSSIFVAAPLMQLAIAAGILNPANVAVVGVVCLAIIAAAAGGFLTEKVQNYVLQKGNPDALDPQDPKRYTLTEEEEQRLCGKGFDVMAVKCAMVAVRARIGEKTPSFFERHLTSSEKSSQENLDLIRKLRQGDIGDFYGRKVIEVDGFTFNLAFVNVAPSTAQTMYPGEQYPRPSAPPAWV